MQFSEINRQFLIDNYLFGIPLEDLHGNPFDNALLDHYIRAAIQYTQRVLQITIAPVDVVDEIHDHYANDWNNWGFFNLHKRPVTSVSSVNMYYGDRKVFEIPQDWIRRYEISGHLQLFPTSGSAGSMLLTASGGMYLPMAAAMYINAPSMWKITYRAGMDEIPEDIVEFIMKRASIGVLQVWGDLIIGAGIANQTISIDGLSQSIGTTQSPEFTGAGARIKNYMDDLKELEKRLKDTYLGINLGIL